MLCRCARLATASWRGAAVGSTSRPSLALLVAGAPSNGAEAQRTTGGADFGVDAPALQRQPRAGLSTAAAAPKLVYAAPREEGRDVVRTPPMEEEDTGPAVREMRAQLRPSNEHGSRGARKLRKGKRQQPCSGSTCFALGIAAASGCCCRLVRWSRRRQGTVSTRS